MTRSTDQADYVDTPPASPVVTKQDGGKYSLHIDVGWAFAEGRPGGQYVFRLNQKDVAQSSFSNGRITIDRKLHSLDGSGELIIKLTDGPTYRAKVILGPLPKTQTAAGLARRLTNLGLYAGTDGTFNGRMAWAVRAFKRIRMNGFIRDKVEVENNKATEVFLTAVRNAFGVHPGDSITGDLRLSLSDAAVPYCGMFGNYLYYRGSFADAKIRDDIDQGPAHTGIWGGVSAAKQKDEPIAGKYDIYLRAFDPSKEIPFSNRINLPQPIHMAQFVLFELGYWLVCGEKDGLVKADSTGSRQKFIPDGWFGRYTQWAAREFQGYAKFDYAAKEDVAGAEKQFLLRVFRATGDHPSRLMGNARYPDDGKVNGELNEETRQALQAWADGALRCPVFACASKIYHSN